ncbi:MAG TPA: helix-turn-helix transcriptional regulator [Nitrospira sp.]|nr:helix-turn-helix transcriptional regulator [Nitrospira sp.]
MIRLREWRRRRGLSLRKLADVAGVHFVTLARLEAGRYDPRLSTLLKLCQVLKIDLADLVKVTRRRKGGD